MESKKFSDVAAKETDEKLTIREGNLYSRKKDPRSEKFYVSLNDTLKIEYRSTQRRNYEKELKEN